MADGSIETSSSEVPRVKNYELKDVSPPLVWPVDPTTYALNASDERRRDPRVPSDDALCVEVGRRLLLAQFEFNQWVLRRVEKVSFASDRRIARRSSIEFRVRNDAPILVHRDYEPSAAENATANSSGKSDRGYDPREYWLIPLSVMRRRTLVGLDLRDETGASLRMLGLRFTQKLDESMLRAAALLGDPTLNGSLPAEPDAYVRRVISGDFDEVKRAKQDYHEWQNAKATDDCRALPGRIAELGRYFDNVLFAAVLERMWHNFTLYAMLPKEKGRHRLLQLAFEEQVTWRYQVSTLTPPDYRQDGSGRRDTLAYLPMQPVKRKDALFELLGFRTTRIRLLTPSAENCASYHFEFTAPKGLGISEAALLAGRPNDQQGESTSKPSWDRVVNPGQTVGLHAVEIPNGSLCRAQVDLRIPSRGWLSTLLVSVVAIALVMFTVAIHARRIGDDGQWTVGQVTNIVLLLVTVTAGAATYVAQHHAGDVASRMVSRLRLVGTAALTIPSMAAILLVYLQDEPQAKYRFWIMTVLALLTLLCTGAAISLLRAWHFTRMDERRRGRPSPWDMSAIDLPSMREPDSIWARVRRITDHAGRDTPQEPHDTPLSLRDVSFDAWVSELGFAGKAIGVASAEGWHEVYGWNDRRQTTALELLGRVDHPETNPTHCTCRHVVSH